MLLALNGSNDLAMTLCRHGNEDVCTGAQVGELGKGVATTRMVVVF